MQKIVVLGCQGSGKSTLAARLGEKLALPVIHLDTLFWETWGARSENPTQEEIRQRIADVVAQPCWVIDGNFLATLEMRLAACDTVVLLDLPRHVCLWRVLKRRVKRLLRRDPAPLRPNEKVTWPLLRAIWRHPTGLRPRIREHIESYERQRRVQILASTADVERFRASA